MMRARGGLVVMIGSVVSMLASPFGGAYSASKAALLALSDSLRVELEPFGVRLTYVTAGAIKTAFADNILGGTQVARYERPDSLYRPLADQIR
jgi:short-subunit dehydrogenase